MNEETTTPLPEEGISLELFSEMTDISSYGNEFTEWTNTTENLKSPNLDFKKLKKIGDYGLYTAFKNSAVDTVPLFPVLTEIGKSGMYQSFMRCKNICENNPKNPVDKINPQAIRFDSLTRIQERGMYQTFVECNPPLLENAWGVTNAVFPELKEITDYGMHQTFMRCNRLVGEFMVVTLADGRKIRTSYGMCFPKLDTIYAYSMCGCFDNCTRIKHVFFPALKYVQKTKSISPVVTTYENIGNVVKVEDEAVSNEKLPYRIVTITSQYRYMRDGNDLPDLNELERPSSIVQSAFKNLFRGCQDITVHLPVELRNTKVNRNDLESSYLSALSARKVDTANMTFEDIWTPSYLGMFGTRAKVQFDLGDNFTIEKE